MAPIRLQKLLSSGGVASRRAAEVLITQGRVTVNGHTVSTLGAKADPDVDDVRVDGRRVKVARSHRYLLLNKPAGVVATRSDPQGRRTVLDLIAPVSGYLYPVGRLDADSEGLLLLTNDGDLAARLTHPSHEVDKTYHAVVRGVPSAGTLAALARGVVIDGRRTAPAEVRLVKSFRTRSGGDGAVVELILREGRNRQVRRMCEYAGHPVDQLRRIRIGPLADPALAVGAWRDLTAAEVSRLKRVASATHRRSPASPPSRR